MVALLTVLLCCTIVSITYWSVAMVATYIGCVVVLCCNVLCFVLFCCVGQYILVSGNCCHIGEQLQWFYFIKNPLGVIRCIVEQYLLVSNKVRGSFIGQQLERLHFLPSYSCV